MTNIIRTKAAEVRSADYMIRIHDYQDRIIKGSIEFSPTGESLEFCGLMPLMDAIEEKLDQHGFPQATMAMRNWDIKGLNGNVEMMTPAAPRPPSTANYQVLASFMLRVQFRQNASWQGNLAWLEARRSMAFRSVLEMTRLLDQAVQQAANSSRAAPAPRPEHRWKAKESVS